VTVEIDRVPRVKVERNRRRHDRERVERRDRRARRRGVSRFVEHREGNRVVPGAAGSQVSVP